MLLVLATTGSPAKAGIVGSAGTLPLLLFTLPAGALVDRWNRKRVMILTDAARCVALASVAIAIALDALTYAQILVVVLVDGTGYVLFTVAERTALPSVVPDEQLPAALARNQTREYAAILGGQPVGGALFALGRAVPFAFDAVTYLVSVCTVALIRTDFRRDPPAERTRLRADMRAGLAWFWRQPFIRTTSVLVSASDFVLNALYLVVIVIARDRGAPPELVGAMFVFLGIGGIVGSLFAPRLAARLRMRTIVAATQVTVAVLVPLLVVVPGEVAPGIVYGAMFVLHPAWNASVGAYRLRVTPPELQGRVLSIASMLSLGPVTVAALAAGFMLEAAGTTPTVLALTALMAVVAAGAVASPSIRNVERPR
jgi:predicted MFS family arabinose efflux permease